jgi:hypothetical protein
VRPTLGFLLGLVFLTLTLGTNAARGTNLAHYSSWLKSLGPDYEVVQGNVFLMTNDKCMTFVLIFDSCFGQNPASPYIIPQPPIEDSYVDPYYANAFSDYVGITPPRARTVSPDPNRYDIFGSIGNGVNNVSVQNQLGVSPWSNAIVVYEVLRRGQRLPNESASRWLRQRLSRRFRSRSITSAWDLHTT